MANFQFGNPVSGYGQHLNREESTHQEQSEEKAVYDAFKINKNLTAVRNQYEPALTSVIEPLARNMALSMGELWQREYNGNTYTEKLSIEVNRYNQQLEFALQDSSTKLSFQITPDNGNFYISNLNTYDFNSRQSNAPLTENQKTAVGALLAHQELQPYFSQNAVNQMYGMLGQEAQRYINPNPQYQGRVQQYQQNPYQQYQQTPQQAPAYQNQSAPQQPQQNFQQYQQQNVTQPTQNNYNQQNNAKKPKYFIGSKTEQERQQAPEFIQMGIDRIAPLAEEIQKNITWKNSGISNAGKPYEMTPNPSVSVSRAVAKEKQGNTWTDKKDNYGNPVYRTDKTNNFVYDASISVTESSGDAKNTISFYLNSDKIKCSSPDMIERIYARNFTENMQGLLQNMWQNGMITPETKTGANIQPFMQYLAQNVPQQNQNHQQQNQSYQNPPVQQNTPAQQIIADAVSQGIPVSQENPQHYQQNPQNIQQNSTAGYGNSSNLYEQIKNTHSYVAFAKDTYGQNDPFIQNGVQKASDYAQQIASALHSQGLMPTYQKQDGTTAESKIVVSVKPATGQFATDKNNNQRYSASLMLKDGNSAVFLNLSNTLQYEPKITRIGQSQGGISERLQAAVNFIQNNGYMYEKNPQPITAIQNVSERPQINIAEQVNRNDPFIMQGVEVMKQLAEQLQQNGIQSPTVFVNKHGEPPVYMAKMMMRDKNTMLNMYVSDKVLKNAIENHTQPTFYDFGGYDLKTKQQSMEVLTPALQQIVQNVQNAGLIQNTELQNITAQYNQTHQDTYAVYHHLGDTYQKFGKPTVCNSEMIELRSRNGNDMVVPMVCVRPDGKTDIAIMDNEQQKMGMLSNSRQLEVYLKSGKLNPETAQLISEIKNFAPVQQEQNAPALNPVITMHRSMTDFYNAHDNQNDAWTNTANLVSGICNSIEANPESLNVSPDSPVKAMMKSAYDIYRSAGKDAVLNELTATYTALGNLAGADKEKYNTPEFRAAFFGNDDANHQINSFEPVQRGDSYLDTVTVRASIDPVSYQQKPAGYEIGNIKNRLGNDRMAQAQDYTVGQILNATASGHTVCLADVDTSQGNHRAEGFRSQQLYYVDIDNAKETVNKEHIRLTQEEGYLSFEQAMQKCQENNINVLYSYDSFSYQQDFERFRLAVLLPEPVTSIQEHEQVVKGLSSVFGQAADQKCFNGDRIFFGTNPQTSHGIRFVADSNQQPIYTDKKVILDLYEKNVGSIQQNSPYQQVDEGQMDLFSSAPAEKESADSILHTLAETGYFNIPRSLEEVGQDLQAENPDIQISDTDLKTLLDSMNIDIIPEEPQQNQPKKEQIQHNDL